MLTEREARELVEQYLSELAAGVAGGLVIYPPTEKPYGWIFSYTSRRYAESGNILDMLAGNGPIVVERANGRITCLGTANHPDISIAEYERARGFGSRLGGLVTRAFNAIRADRSRG
jgi:hypothetical protein